MTAVARTPAAAIGLAGLAALALAAAPGCAGKASGPGAGTGPGTATPVDVADDEPTGLEPDRTGPEEAPQEERIAAIQVAMNQLAPVANQCWAAGAADDLALTGNLSFDIVVGAKAGPGAEVSVASDTTGDDVLVRCLSAVLGAYPWAPPLAGQTVELPFHFSAPAMQNVIDRRLVRRAGQAAVEVGVLLDQRNTANPAASLLEVTIAAGGKSGPRAIERTELWSLRGPATVSWPGLKAPRALVAGDALIVPAGARLEVNAPAGAPVTAVVALVPGGREGSARAGALPGPAASPSLRALPVQPIVVPLAGARRYPRTGGATTILVEAPAAGGVASLSYFEADPDVRVPLHQHAGQTEILYLTGGGGTMTVAGVELPVDEHSVIQIPAGVEHGFVAGARGTTAVQLYTPAGPEQRFKTMK